MSVVDPFVVDGSGQVRDDSWPFSSITISTDTTEASTEPSPLPELCICPRPSEVTLLSTTVEAVTAINCKALSIPTDMQSTVLTVTISGNACNDQSELAISVGSGGTPPGTGGGEPPGDSITVRFALDMMSGGNLSSDTVETTYTALGLPIDTADYPEMDTAWWQMTVLPATVTSNDIIDLVDDLGAIKASVTVPSRTPVLNQAENLDMVEFTPTTGSHTYYFRTRAGTAVTLTGAGVISTGYYIHASRIFVDCINPSKGKVQIILTNFDQFNPVHGIDTADATLNNGTSFCANVNNASAIYSNSALLPPTWLYEASKWSSITGIELELVARMTRAAAGTALCGLREGSEFSGSVQPSSIITVNSGTSISRYTAAISAFTTGSEYRAQFNYSTANKPTNTLGDEANYDALQIYRCALYLTVVRSGGSFTAQLYNQIYAGLAASSTSPVNDVGQERFTYDSTKYPSGTTWYRESTGNWTSTGVAEMLMGLWDSGTSDTGTSGSLVTGSTSDFVATTTLTRMRSGAVTLTDGNRYRVVLPVAHTLFKTSQAAFLIAEVTVTE